MKPESFEKKLYIARNVEGEPNEQKLAILRELEKRLAEEESFVGLAPFGSAVGGYSTEESDLDVYALYDFPKGAPLDFWRNVHQEIKKIKLEIEKEQKIKIHLISTNINPQFIIDNIKLGVESKNNPGEFVGTELAEMSRIVTGKKIDQCRKVISDKLQELPAEQKQQLADSVVESLTRRDIMSLSKRIKRMNNLSEENHQKILEERKKMWRDRVSKIWRL